MSAFVLIQNITTQLPWFSFSSLQTLMFFIHIVNVNAAYSGTGVYPSCENAIYASRYLCSVSSLCKIM